MGKKQVTAGAEHYRQLRLIAGDQWGYAPAGTSRRRLVELAKLGWIEVRATKVYGAEGIKKLYMYRRTMAGAVALALTDGRVHITARERVPE